MIAVLLLELNPQDNQGLGGDIMENIDYEKLARAIVKVEKEQEKKDKPKSAQKEERKVSHAYQEKSEIINGLTGKKLSTYIDKTNLKTPSSTKDKPNPNPFPMTKSVAMTFFKDHEIAGKPWISYKEQLVILDKLMTYYKYTKKSKIAKYNDLLKYLDSRIKAIEGDKKMKKYFKEHRTMSLELVKKDINTRLEKLL